MSPEQWIAFATAMITALTALGHALHAKHIARGVNRK